ncbi:Hypothetical protein CINCED_3A022229 [Cinara cedri]|uniref:Uncharacterized protein n=1 Tax=Cinara cedri TaxID=506608 RepID=A0A5E4MCA2_9HEMI|nr:Hypothetical protein CINCED_3A022229 [Cinara cedri]
MSFEDCVVNLDKDCVEEYVKDCNEYHRRRLNEISNFIGHELPETATRDKLIAVTLRLAANRNADRDSSAEKKLRDAVVVTRGQLETYNECATKVVNNVRLELDRFVNGLRMTKEHHGINEGETVGSILEEITNLTESVRLIRRHLVEAEADIQCVENLLHRERGENDQIKCTATKAVIENQTRDEICPVLVVEHEHNYFNK